jgi:hypothetical protein
MKKLLPLFVLLCLTACSHTQEENYDMAGKVVGRLTEIKDSLAYFDSSISSSYPESNKFMQVAEDGKRYARFFIDSLKKAKDTTQGKLLVRYNELQEQNTNYREIFDRIYRRLPKDSVQRNAALKMTYDRAIK